jgi:hypothetical protein
MTRVAVDPGRLIGRLDRNVFGGFVEHLGRCIYGGIFDEGSILSAACGYLGEAPGDRGLRRPSWYGASRRVAVRLTTRPIPDTGRCRLARRLATQPSTHEGPLLPGKGLDLRKLVAGAGFEPATSGL